MEPIITNVDEIKLIYTPRKTNLAETKLCSAHEAANLLMTFYDMDTIHIREEFIVIYLNSANSVIGVYRGFQGGITQTAIDFRLILNIGLRCLCTGIIVSHNHPSGRLKASTADIESTKNLTKCCDFHNIKLLDHVIVSPKGAYLSMSDAGLM